MFTLKEIAGELGIPPARLRRWLRRDEMEWALHEFRTNWRFDREHAEIIKRRYLFIHG